MKFGALHMDVQKIVIAIRNTRVHITDHATIEMENDQLAYSDICYSVTNSGEVVERYPSDKPYPSCLILGWKDSTTPIHSVWAYNADTLSAVLITVYRPDPRRWIDWKTRVFQ